MYRSWYSLLYGAGYRQRSGAGLINTVQGHVWQVVVIAVTFDLPWRQAVGVYVCCEDGTQTRESVGTCVHLLLSVCVCVNPEYVQVKSMCACMSATLLSTMFSIPLHVQLTGNHIHNNDKLSHERPEDNTKVQIRPFAAVLFSENILIISKLALSLLWFFSFAQQPRKTMPHIWLASAVLTMTLWANERGGLCLLSCMTKLHLFHKLWQLLPWTTHWIYCQSLQPFCHLCLHGHRLRTSWITREMNVKKNKKQPQTTCQRRVAGDPLN